MIKTPPTLARMLIMVVFALSSFGMLIYLWIAFGGATPLKPKGYELHILIPEATQLAEQGDVRISGVTIGKIIKLDPAPKDRTDATVRIDSKFAPIPRDTKAMLRLKTLLGETYIELTPGHRSAGTIPDGGTLSPAALSPTVQLDEIIGTFDAKTRRAWRTWMQSSAEAVRGRGADINALFGQLPGFTEHFGDLLATLDAQSAAVRKTVSTTGEVFDAISRRQGELAGLIEDADKLFAVTASRNRQLAEIFRALPSFERESRMTLPELTRFGRSAEPVLRQLQPAADEMGPAFEALDELSPEFQGFFRQLGDVISASQKGVPALDRILQRLPSLLAAFQPFLRNANPMVDYIGKHERELTAFFANGTAASSARDKTDVLDGANEAVHYLRTAQRLSPESLALAPRPLGSTRANAYQLPGAFTALGGEGLPVLTAAPCSNGDPAPPAGDDLLSALVRNYAFRTDGRDIARPACRTQGAYPGFGTLFPQLRAEP